jgi:hypothetical protein
MKPISSWPHSKSFGVFVVISLPRSVMRCHYSVFDLRTGRGGPTGDTFDGSPTLVGPTSNTFALLARCTRCSPPDLGRTKPIRSWSRSNAFGLVALFVMQPPSSSALLAGRPKFRPEPT